jgi:PAS domain S-box-containing protein
MRAPLRVLIIEDSEDDAVLVERQLRDGGYDPTVERVDTPEGVTAALDGKTWDAVIADYRLPRFDALGALTILRERGLDLPFLVVSGSIGEDIAVAAMKAGAHDYIMKDNLARLVPAIERELREAAGRRERRRAEEQLHASEARCRILFENAHDAIGVWDESGKLIDANQAYCDLLGYSREELLGGGVPPDGGETLPDLLGRLREAGTLRGEFPVLHRDGSQRIADVNGMRVAPGLYMSILRDTTERKALERQLQQAQRVESIGTLAGGIAHDFNNTLTGISGFADLALMHLSPAHPLWQDLQRIRKQAEHAATLTRQLLAFSRRQILERKHVDLNEIVAETQAFLRRVIGEHIDLTLAPAPKLDTAYVDPVQVEQVLMNLCVNARDAMPDGGRLTIETANVRLDDAFVRAHPWARPGDYVRISVSDTGVGMDEQTLLRIFDPFFTTKEPGKGTGLGLAMVYGIVKQHEGLIHVYSEPGRGSTFKVYFRAVSADAERIERPADEAPGRGNETILVAEDDEMVRELVVRTLEGQGYEVLAAADGEEAVRAFGERSDGIALAILDAVMPKMGGREAYEALRGRKPALKFLVVSGYSVNSIDERFIREAGLQFLQKPFSPTELARRVRELLDA